MANLNVAVVLAGKDNNASRVINNVVRELSGLERAAGTAGRGLGGLVDGLGRLGLATIGVRALADSAKGLGNALGIGLNVELENVEAQLVAFTKDGAAAKAILADIRKEANTTPFAFAEMAKATAGLMSSARQASVPLMELVRDAEILAASNPAQGLEGAAFALREAVSGDFTSIIERFDLPRQYINQLKEQGVPALEIVRRAMQAVGYDADLVGNLAKTASGKWSTLMDTLDGIRQRASAKLFDNLKIGLTDVQTWLDQNKAAIDEWADSIGTGLSNAFTSAVQIAQDAKAEWEDLNETQQKGVLLLTALMLAGGPLVGAIKGVALAAYGIASAFDFAIAKAVILPAALAVAMKSIGDMAAGGKFDMESYRKELLANAGDIVNKIITPLSSATAEAMGDTALAASLEQIGALKSEMRDLEVRQNTAQMQLENAQRKYQDSLQGKDQYGRVLEFSAIYENQAKWAGEVAFWEDKIASNAARRREIEQQIDQMDLGPEAAKGAMEAAGKVADWALEVSGLRDVYGDLIDTIFGAKKAAFDMAQVAQAAAGSALANIANNTNATFLDVAAVAKQTAGTSSDAWQNYEASVKKAGQTTNSLLGGGSYGGTSKTPLQRAVEAAKDEADDLKDALGKAQGKMRDLLNTGIQGEQAYADKIFAIQQSIKKLELEQLQLGPVPNDRDPRYARYQAIASAIEGLRRQEDILQHETDLKFEPLHRQLELIAEPKVEKPFAEILKGITDTRQEMNTLEPKVDAATSKWETLERQLRDTERAYDGVTGAALNAASAVNSVPLPGAPSQPALPPPPTGFRGRPPVAYAEGGWLTEPILGVGLNSGTPYSFGERGEPEYVIPASDLRGQPAAGAVYLGNGPLVSMSGFVIRTPEEARAVGREAGDEVGEILLQAVEIARGQGGHVPLGLVARR
mgnify:CR=1 FL=1